MKSIGLLGGMSWESTVTYYQLLNQEVRSRLGKHHSAKIILNSLDFEEVRQFQREQRWEDAASFLSIAAQNVEQAGAEVLLICTNTMHIVADEVQKNIDIPLVHIADATAEAIVTAGMKSIGLLGTNFTMSQAFYSQRLSDKFSLEVLVPDSTGCTVVDKIIFEELCLGKILPASRDLYLREIGKLMERGAQGVILGCTEIPLLITEAQSPIPLFDTARLHVLKALEIALQ